MNQPPIPGMMELAVAASQSEDLDTRDGGYQLRLVLMGLLALEGM